MALRIGTTLASCSTERDDGWNLCLEPKHKVFLSHSGAQKAFVEHLCMELEGRFVFPFFDKRHESLPIGENFPGHIFAAIQQCHVGVVILSEGFFMSKWPMMELVAMVEEVEKRKSSFKIIPVFFGTSLKEFDDPITRTQWQLRWQELSLNTNRIEVEKWEASVKYLRGINGLVYDGLNEVRFQRMVVDAICEVVPAEIRLEDSHIQGRSRICKEIRDKIDELRKDKIDEVCVMGLYGTGGIGKTSICKALCNDFHMNFRGKVCHAELERVSKEELLRDVVKRLSNASHERLDRFNIDELENALKGGVIKEAIFLALDNMSDSDTSITEVKTYLSARLPHGSIVMVTARSKSLLIRVRPYISEEKCMEMPELEIEEAKSLFAKSSSFKVENEDDVQLMQRCVERCRFLKGGVVKEYHYHPLALDVLGRQLGYIDPSEWKAQLDKIDEDIFNQSKENDHPIFSILRKSFDALSAEDQVLFMDIALYLPDGDANEKDISMQFEWLGMMHGLKSVEDVLAALQRLKRKSLLEEVGDGKRMRSGMHDLWHAFSIAETKYGLKKQRRWVYENHEYQYRLKGQSACHSDMVETSNICWKNVRRMAFVGYEPKIVKGVNFVLFPNITALKVIISGGREELTIDLSGLCHLKSLEARTQRAIVHNLPKGLIFLKGLKCHSCVWHKSMFDTEESMNQIGCMEELQYLDLSCHTGGKLPDMKSMFSLCVARLSCCNNVVTLTGLGSQLGQLRVLDLHDCSKLRSCPGVGELTNLEELICFNCTELERLPNLRKLAKLQKLDVSGCKNIKELPGLNDLVALEGLRAIGCFQLQKLPDMHKLRKLRILDLNGCPLDAVLGFNSLSSLEEVAISFYNEEDKPSLRHLTKVQRLVMHGWSLRGLRDVPSLVMLEILVIYTCCGVEELPDLRSLVRLQLLEIRNCDFKDVSDLKNLRVLNRLCICECKELERLPDLQRLTRLEFLLIENCPMVRGWGCTLGIDEGTSCLMDDTSNLFVGPVYERVRNWHEMTLKDCGLVDLTGIGAFSKLEALVIESLPAEELPDLSVFPCLKTVRLSKCESLRGLESCSPVTALLTLSIGDCKSLAMVPDLCQFPVLQKLELSGCPRLPLLSCGGPLHALREFEIKDCSGLKELPDMGMFPELRMAVVQDMNALTGLRCSMPLTAMHRLEVNDCSGLQEVPDLGMFPALERMTLEKLGSLSTWSSIGPVPTSGEVEGSSVVLDQSDPSHSRRNDHCRVTLTDCGFADLRGIGAFSGLTELDISSLQVLEVADLSNFPRLRSLTLSQCERLTRLTSCEPMLLLQSLEIRDCASLETVPDLSECPELRRLDLKKCHHIMSLSSTGTKLPALEVLKVEDCSTGLEEVLEWEMFPAMERVRLTGYRGLKLLRNLEFLTGLCELDLSGCTNLATLPDLSALRELKLSGCENLATLPVLSALRKVKLSGCTNLATLPDLSAFPQLRRLELSECHEMTSLSSTRPSTKLEYLNIMDCRALQQLPDLGLFPALEAITVLKLGRLTTLSCGVPLSALREIRVKECGGLSVEHLDQLRALAVPGCKLEYVPSDAAVVQVSPDSATPRPATLVDEDAGWRSWLPSFLLR